jgi:hypothetical protein
MQKKRLETVFTIILLVVGFYLIRFDTYALSFLLGLLFNYDKILKKSKSIV